MVNCGAVAFVLMLAIGLAPWTARADPAFDSFLQSVWPDAQAQSIARPTFDFAIRGLEPDLSLPDLVIPGQPDRSEPGQA